MNYCDITISVPLFSEVTKLLWSF